MKKNFLAGLDLPNSISAANTAARHWLDTIANVRDHRETRQQPAALFLIEKPALRPLPTVPTVPTDTSVTRLVRVTNRCRVVLDTQPLLRALPPCLPTPHTAAVLDSLLHHGEVVVIEGSSYRMKDRIES